MHGKYAVVGDFDPDTANLSVRARRLEDRQSALRGRFADLAGSYMVFYRDDDGALKVAYRGRILLIDRTSVRWTYSQGKACLRLAGDGTPDLIVEYPSSGDMSDPEDPTPFAEPDDRDLGLFIYNVANEPRRLEGIYR